MTGKKTRRIVEGDECRDLGFSQCRKTQMSRAVEMPEPFEVETLEGLMKGKAGDYLMKGVDGEFYPCDRSIFERTYEFI